ncbi:flagellar biosynthesis protein [Thermovibrio guaymasensis]|uniref:Flagellar biosynthesis protein n=1 Tax=Thermovibrio guaymasensis TaxID=240167 RepID=A0A420W8D8_9BACT|nr:EscU/YscU/HrcU family type III secretion system export apparatus switch protein [Thermovibrio guaymasensis]RKQ63542.1 flagellar biosynthesis protein [Thermovibrio guaymasensis]
MEKKKAAALKYERGKGAPQVVAKGQGKIADKIVELARKNGVPILEDRELVELLVKVDVGKEIPPQLYKAVAKILAYVYKVTGRLPKSP